MAVRHCCWRGRTLLLTRLLCGSVKRAHHFSERHSFPKTYRCKFENSGFLASGPFRFLGVNKAKPLCFVPPRCNYSQTYKATDSEESSENSEEDSDDNANKEELSAQLVDIFTNEKNLSSSQWEDTIKLMSLENHLVTAVSCDAMVMKRCQRYENYALATCYLDHLKRQGREPNLVTLGLYLQLCGESIAVCGEERVLEMYRQLMSRTKILDVRLNKNAILGLVTTSEWRQALTHLPFIKRMSRVCETIYSAIITAAFKAGDYDLGWHYLETMMQEEKVPQDSVFLEWVRQCEAAGGGAQERETMALTLLQKLEAHEVFPSVAAIGEMSRLFQERLGWSAHFCKVPYSGRCPACGYQLEENGVTEEEYKELQEEFVPRVLKGSDIFLSTSPKEWHKFQEFVEQEGPFSVVVDGLNVSYVLGKKADSGRAFVLREMVEQIVRDHPESRVLVIGRQHMKRWISKYQWKEENVKVYTLSNMTRDDCFFLYAALQSGLGTQFITSDRLRDHLFRLQDCHLRDIFRRWQRTHQVMAAPAFRGRARLLVPAGFSTVAQQARREEGGGWHIPYDDATPRQSYELPSTWLCLQPTPLTVSPFLLTVSHAPFQHSKTRKTSDPDAALKVSHLGNRRFAGYSGGHCSGPNDRSRSTQEQEDYDEQLKGTPKASPKWLRKGQREGDRVVGKVRVNTIFDQSER